MGEGGTIGAPAAIANALSDALAPLGAEIFELPMTPQRTFRLIAHVNAQSRARACSPDQDGKFKSSETSLIP